MKHLLIIGARGFGREVFRTFVNTKQFLSGDITVKGFLDDNSDALEGVSGDWPPIISSVEAYDVDSNDIFFCALGDPIWRKYYSDIVKVKGGKFISIVHTTAILSPTSSIGEGCFIGAYSIISTNVTIGDHVMIQAFDNLGHDSKVNNYASIESYVFLGGYASVGEFSVMHTRSSILPHKSIGRRCVVGLASVVMRNFKDGLHLFGNPARIIDF